MRGDGRTELMQYQRVPALHGWSTILPSCDFETFSEAGYVWEQVPGYLEWKQRKRKLPLVSLPPEPVWVPPTVKLASLPGIANSNRGLPVVGVRNYVRHPTFEVLSLAYDMLDGLGVRHWTPSWYTGKWPEQLRAGCYETMLYAQPWALLEHVANGGLLGGWNVIGFEWEVWNGYCVPTWGWPELKMEQCRDTQAKAAVSAYPRKLSNAGKVIFIPGKEDHLHKDAVGDTLIRKLTAPRNPTKPNPALRWTPQTAAEDFAKFYKYNKQDVVSEMALNSRIPDLSPRELRIAQTSDRVNERGMQIDTKAMEDCICVMEQAFAKYEGELRNITGNRITSANEVAKILAWAYEAHGVELRNLDEDYVENILTNLRSPLPPAISRVLQIRQKLAFASVKKLYKMRAEVCADGRLRHQYAYAAAHTFLWNGQGVQ